MQASLWPSRRAFLVGTSLALLLILAIAHPAFAQGEAPPSYRDFPVIGSRVAVWIVAQVHLMLAAFMLGVPMFALVVEYVGVRSRERRYDDLAREFTKLILVAASTTAVFGALLTFLLFTLYPQVMSRLADVFLPTMVLYPLLFFGEVFALYLYWYSWDRLNTRSGKRWHLLIGLVLNLIGTTLMFVANAWLTFSISPESGGQPLYDQAGAFTGTLWQAINNATWWPINIHRVIANIAFGGAVVGLYAAIRFLNSRSEQERAHYDWMGYVGNFIAVIFLSANYYLWIGMGRIQGGERYRGRIKWLLAILTLGVLVWATPHNPVVTAEEQALIGGAFHPLLGVLGVMSAKNTAVNLMILTTFVSFLFYRRAGKGEPLPFGSQGRTAKIVLIVVLVIAVLLSLAPALYVLRDGLAETSRLLRVGLSGLHGLLLIIGVILTFRDRGKLGQWIILGSAAGVVLFFGIYGYFVEATIRIGFSVYQVLAVLSALISTTAIDVFLFQGAPSLGTIAWGKIPARAQYVLILLAVGFTWLMGLMGYARNAIRQHWHIYEVLQDTSADAFSPTLGFAARVISVCVLVFLGLMGFIFWLGNLSEKKAPAALRPEALPAAD